MQLLKLNTIISEYAKFELFANHFQLNKNDLIITNKFLFDPYMKDLGLECNFIFQEKYGIGEPTDIMINNMLKDINNIKFDRVIAVGGGTVIDIAKLFVLENLEDVVLAFERKMPLKKVKQLIVIPTTCGTGSEVTNISIAELTTKQTKMGLADDSLMPDYAILIPEFLQSLPFNFYIYSGIDALIHAVEAYLSPKANTYTQLFSIAAIESIIKIFKSIVEQGEESRFLHFKEILFASNFAGIAFGNAGVGAVHALSYPIGGNYHVAHGEANYTFFTAILRLYNQKNPNGEILKLNTLLARFLGVETNEVYNHLDSLLNNLLKKKRLGDYGMKTNECIEFANSVLEKQTRLLANNYVALTKEEITEIYNSLY